MQPCFCRCDAKRTGANIGTEIRCLAESKARSALRHSIRRSFTSNGQHARRSEKRVNMSVLTRGQGKRTTRTALPGQSSAAARRRRLPPLPPSLLRLRVPSSSCSASPAAPALPPDGRRQPIKNPSDALFCSLRSSDGRPLSGFSEPSTSSYDCSRCQIGDGWSSRW
jgi:hypothetical protein